MRSDFDGLVMSWRWPVRLPLASMAAQLYDGVTWSDDIQLTHSFSLISEDVIYTAGSVSLHLVETQPSHYDSTQMQHRSQMRQVANR